MSKTEVEDGAVAAASVSGVSFSPVKTGAENAAPDGAAPALGQRGLPSNSSPAVLRGLSLESASEAKRRTHREVMQDYWREVHEGKRPAPQGKERPADPDRNPLLDLPEKDRGELFAWLRDCPFHDAIDQMLHEKGLDGITREQINTFFQLQAESHWEYRLGRAAEEANALVRLAENSQTKFSAGILAALGQEAFRQVASGQVEPEAMGKLATLFMRARSDERADQMQELKREKLRIEMQDQFESALEKLAEEVDGHPSARAAFEALKRELAIAAEEKA